MLVTHDLECSKCGRIECDVAIKNTKRLPRCGAMRSTMGSDVKKCRGKREIIYDGRSAEWKIS